MQPLVQYFMAPSNAMCFVSVLNSNQRGTVTTQSQTKAKKTTTNVRKIRHSSHIRIALIFFSSISNKPTPPE